MNKIYVVIKSDYDYTEIGGVFSTPEKANRFAEELKKTSDDYINTREVTIDAKDNFVAKKCYSVWIEGGEIDQREDLILLDPNNTPGDVGEVAEDGSRHGFSYTSFEDALKAAKETSPLDEK